MKSLDHLREDFDAIKISLASPTDILEWSYGEVTKPETINYRTYKPEKDGLFCERIFGPAKDFECSCGKYKRVRYKGVVCDKCGVEVTFSRVRRERMGHIKLASPCVHVWFFKGIPSQISTLLNIAPRKIESVTYYASFLVLDVDGNKKADTIESLNKELKEEKEALKKRVQKQIEQLKKDLQEAETRKKGIAEREGIIKIQSQIRGLEDGLVKEQKNLEEATTNLEKTLTNIKPNTVLTDLEYLDLSYYIDQFAEIATGADAIKKALTKVNLKKLETRLSEKLATSRGQKRIKLGNRLGLVQNLIKSGVSPDWMVLEVLPVIPPELRPMVQLEGGRFATSDLNDLYRRVLNRNNRLQKLLDIGAPEVIVRNERRMLQEAVDSLIDSSKSRARRTTRSGRKELKSLSDMLKGKQGRFRQNLLGKRVDYSGRSVIVIGPNLNLDQCGLPKEMALELFKPFVLHQIMLRGYAPNVKSARKFFSDRSPEVWDILEEVSANRPVLLNRAPTLHRLGIQGFYPRLIEGKAIQIHPCVCAGFNADFDGDQMAVHVPLSQNAVEESIAKIMSSRNLLKPASGTPIVTPIKDIVLGTYYLTAIDADLPKIENKLFTPEEAQMAYEQGAIKLRQLIKVKWQEQIIETTVGRVIFNEALPTSLQFFNDETTKSGNTMNNLLMRTLETDGEEATVHMIDKIKNLGFKFARISGTTMALSDAPISPERDKLIEKAEKRSIEINNSYLQGLMTLGEKQRLNEALWIETTQEVAKSTWESLDKKNPVNIIVTSGAGRGSKEQVNQISGMRGLMIDPTGHVVELPIKSNLRLGLSAFDYFVSVRGSRKGFVDTALRTADAGYLTRRLVDVSQDLIIREQDCGTTKGIEITKGEENILTTYRERLISRVTAEPVKKGGKTIIAGNKLITEQDADAIEKAGIEQITVRSPLTCTSRYGICAACYGKDLGEKGMTLVKIGVPVGVIAAQSIGEPGTQLTMRTKHTSGAAVAKDITQGLPRVEELFEARSPKMEAEISEIDGQIVKIEENSVGEQVVTIKNSDPKSAKKQIEYRIDPVFDVKVQRGDLITKGMPLTTGNLDVNKLLRNKDAKTAQRYIVAQVQDVYSSQGVPLNDKHVEVIVRQMFSKVRIKSPGDSDLMPGNIVSKTRFDETNEGLRKKDKAPAVAEAVVMGISKVSLNTDSFLSAASFIHTTNVLTESALSGKVDKLLGLKENVILGRLIPVGERARVEQ